MNTRCKEGDLAKITVALRPVDKGRYVLVMHAVDIPEDGPKRPWWAIQSISGPVAYEDRDGCTLTGAVGLASVVCIPDECLQPVPRLPAAELITTHIDIVV